ncbi:MAG: replicative DNA helicase [Dehalococcoidia bacterium]|nr:replicative DNA helicase [Dehalococcoidia bacterium]
MYAERLPPHDVDAEEAVVGSLLIDGEAMSRVASFLKPDDFYQGRNRWCYEACFDLYQRREAINQVTLAHELGRRGRLDEVGGNAYLSHLVAMVPTSLHLEHYAQIVSRTAIMRGLIQAAGEIAAIGYEGRPDPEAALTDAEKILFRLHSAQGKGGFVPLREVLDQYLEDTANAQTTPLERRSAPILTGFADLDELLGGMQRSDLLVLAARPSVGKSTLAVNVARHAAGLGGTVGIFSLEMSREQLAQRLLASEAGVDSHRLRLGLYTQEEEGRIINAVGVLSDLPIYIDDTPLASIVEIRGKANRLWQERGADLFIVDHMQLVRGPQLREYNRVQEMGEISRSLKGLARDLNVSILAVSQLSRAVEQRPTHRPQLSDLRESGSIEQDADVVVFIYREEMYYTEEEWESRFEGRPYPRNIAEIIVAKHRHGPIDTINLFFRDRYARFETLAAGQGAR